MADKPTEKVYEELVLSSPDGRHQYKLYVGDDAHLWAVKLKNENGKWFADPSGGGAKRLGNWSGDGVLR